MTEENTKTKETTKEKGNKGRVLRGVVVSDKMKDTVVVSVGRYLKHAKYGKYRKVQKRYKVHDEGNRCSLGQKVDIIETIPVSKDKHFRIFKREEK